MYLRTCGRFKSAKHKKIGVRKSQIRKVSHLRRSVNLTSYLGPEICGFAISELICGPATFDLTTILCRPVHNMKDAFSDFLETIGKFASLLPAVMLTELASWLLSQSFLIAVVFSSIGTGGRAVADIDRDGGTAAAAAVESWPLITPLRERLAAWVLFPVPPFSGRSFEFLAKKFCQYPSRFSTL